VLSCIATIKLLLRRTLVRSVILLNQKLCIFRWTNLSDMRFKPYLLRVVLITALFSITEVVYMQTNNSKTDQTIQTYIYYAYSGLGSNMGSFQPTLRIKGTKFKYTYEQNSYWGKKSKRVDKISSGNFRQESIDSILALVQGLKDTFIFKSNPCIMSGGIHYLIISDGRDTTEFELGNTFDYTALRIINIINEYLPKDKRIWATEELIKKEEDCYNALFKEADKKKNSNE